MGRRAAWVFPAILAVGLGLSGGAAAQLYEDGTAHYRFSAPNDWLQWEGGDEYDVVFLNSQLNGVFLYAGHHNDTAVRNTEAWLLSKAVSERDAFNDTVLDEVEVRAPRTFANRDGRLASDFVMDYREHDTTQRTRFVYFASDAWDEWFVFRFEGYAPAFDYHTEDWDRAVETFAVVDEPDPAPEGGGLPGPGAIGAALAIAAAAVAWSRGRQDP